MTAVRQVAEVIRDEAFHKVSMPARLLYLLLPSVTYGDDGDGRGFDADPRFLADALFPYDMAVEPERIRAWLDELARAELVHIVLSSGGTVGVLAGPLARSV